MDVERDEGMERKRERQRDRQIQGHLETDRNRKR